MKVSWIAESMRYEEDWNGGEGEMREGEMRKIGMMGKER